MSRKNLLLQGLGALYYPTTAFSVLGLLLLAGCSAEQESDSGATSEPRDGYSSAPFADGTPASAAVDELAEEDEFLAELLLVAEEDPDAEKFDFIGYHRGADTPDHLWVHGDVEYASDLEDLVEAALAAEGHSKDSISDLEDGVARGVLASLDGRVFLEKPEVIALRRAELSKLPTKRSWVGEQPEDFEPKSSEPEPSEPEAGLGVVPSSPSEYPEGPRPLAMSPRVASDRIYGSDNRSYVMSAASSFPYRAIGVQVLKSNSPTQDPPLEDNDYAGSAVMIHPRAAMSNKHIVKGAYDSATSHKVFWHRERVAQPIPVKFRNMINRIFLMEIGSSTGSTGPPTLRVARAPARRFNTTMGYLF